MTSGDPSFWVDFLFFFGFSIFRLVRFRFLIRRSWVTSGDPPFLLFLVDFLFLVGFLCPVFLVLVGFLFPFFLSVFYFLIGAFLCLSISSRSPWMSMKPKEGTPIRSRPRGRGALGLGGIEVSRDSRSVQPVFRRSL